MVAACPASTVRRRKSASTRQFGVAVAAAYLVHRGVHPPVQPVDLRAALPAGPDEHRAAIGGVAFPANPAAALQPVQDAGHRRRVQPGAAGQRARADRLVTGDHVEAVHVGFLEVQVRAHLGVEQGELDAQLAHRLLDRRSLQAAA